MLLFILSLIFVGLSSYLVASVLKPRSFLSGFIYFLVTAFAQIVLIAELLSPFKLLYPVNFLLVQFLFIAIIVFVWVKSGRPLLKKTPLSTFKSIIKCLIADKALLILGAGFVFFLIVSLFLCIVMEIRSGDAEIYHVARSLFWVKNHSINHFYTPQVRMLAFPINSEILYSWVILFTHKLSGLCLFSFTGFVLSVSSLFGLMKRFCISRRLWVIFIVSSFASVLGQASITETDIIIAGLVLASMYLYKEGIINLQEKNSTGFKFRKETLVPLFMSALCYALAIGTKTTAFFLIPAVALYMLYNSYKNLSKDYLRPFFCFLVFGVINFLLFAAYNYVENIIWFANPLGSYNTIEMHKNFYGLRGAVANSIKNFVLFFDFTGFTWNVAVGKIIIPVRDIILHFLHLSDIPDGANSGNSAILNNTILAPSMGCGILGLMVFLPSIVYSLFVPLFNRNKKIIEYFIYALMFVITFLVMSASIVFMTYNNRFIASFIVVCAPVIGCTYFKKFKPGKWIIVFFAMFYLTLVSTHLWHQPAGKIFDALFVKHQDLKEIRQRQSWTLYDKNIDILPMEFKIVDLIKQYPKGIRFIIFPTYSAYFTTLVQLNNEGYSIDIEALETFDINRLNNYDVIIYSLKDQSANVAYRYNKNKNAYNIINNEIVFKDTGTPINCIYFSKDNKVIRPGEDINPTGVQCILSEKYLYDRGYRTNNIVYEDPLPGEDSAVLKYIFLKKRS